MGRRVEFDQELALKKAMMLFWSKGFESTSIQDLVDSLKINRFSLYNTFGDKKSLFLKSLLLYRESVFAKILSPLKEKGTGKSKLNNYLTLLQEQIEHDCDFLGCLIQNSSLSLVARDRDVALILRGIHEDLRTSIQNVIEQALSENEISNKSEPSVLTEFILCHIQGMILLQKSHRKAGMMNIQVDYLRQQIETW